MDVWPDETTWTFIYVLLDPFDFGVRYIGRSRHPVRRFQEHIKECGSLCKKGRWLADVIGRGEEPVLAILERIDERVSEEREVFWIGRFERAGCTLTNVIRKSRNALVR